MDKVYPQFWLGSYLPKRLEELESFDGTTVRSVEKNKRFTVHDIRD